MGMLNPMLTMRETVLCLSAVSCAPETFPNLESLVVASRSRVDATKLCNLCDLPFLQHLEIGGHFHENSTIFSILQKCLQLKSLRILCKNLSYNDCRFLAKAVPGLTSLCLIPCRSVYSRRGFAELLSSLPDLEIIRSLEGDVFHRLPMMSNLRELELSYATIEDVRSIGIVAVSLEKLTLFNPQDELDEDPDFFSCMTMLRGCQLLTFLRFSSRVLFRENDFTVDEILLFPNMKDVYLASMIGTESDLSQGFQERLGLMFPAVEKVAVSYGRGYFLSH